MLDNLRQLLTDDPVLLTGSAMIISLAVGFLLSYFLTKRGWRYKSPVWTIRTTVLGRDFRSVVEGLAVTYGGRPVKNVAISRVMLWNDGSETVDRGDVIAEDPIRVVLKHGADILDAKVIQSNAPTNRFEVILSADGRSAIVGFEYMDRGEGAVLQIVHTGTSPDDLSVVGTIKGATLRRRDRILDRDRRWPPSGRVYRGRLRRQLEYIFIFMIIMIFGVFLIMVPPGLLAEPFRHPLAWVLLIAGLLWSVWRVLSMERVPKGLEAFEKEV